VLLAHLNTALDRYHQALTMASADDHGGLASRHNDVGNIYHEAGDTRQALRHYQQSIQHEEARGNTYGAGQTRYTTSPSSSQATAASPTHCSTPAPP